jgi:hypothetical protein
MALDGLEQAMNRKGFRSKTDQRETRKFAQVFQMGKDSPSSDVAVWRKDRDIAD